MTTSDSPEAEGDEFSPDFSVFSPCAFLLGSVPILQVANLTGHLRMSSVARIHIIAHMD